MNSHVISPHIQDVTKQMTVKLKLRGVRTFTARIWLATQLIKLAGLIMPFGVVVQINFDAELGEDR